MRRRHVCVLRLVREDFRKPCCCCVAIAASSTGGRQGIKQLTGTAKLVRKQQLRRWGERRRQARLRHGVHNGQLALQRPPRAWRTLEGGPHCAGCKAQEAAETSPRRLVALEEPSQRAQDDCCGSLAVGVVGLPEHLLSVSIQLARCVQSQQEPSDRRQTTLPCSRDVPLLQPHLNAPQHCCDDRRRDRRPDLRVRNGTDAPEPVHMIHGRLRVDREVHDHREARLRGPIDPQDGDPRIGNNCCPECLLRMSLPF
mmetsp:Transcript_76478/g.222120  ORF Transcript_76478/g.222120 Transcript_76478/m.222120 type:complete len:255 (-) Transcript_76478:729-1493(-)